LLLNVRLSVARRATLQIASGKPVVRVGLDGGNPALKMGAKT